MRINSSRLLFGAFATVVASFVAAGVLEQYASRDVDLASDAIISNAAPSIEHLAALRSEVWQSEFLLGDWLEKHASGRKADDAAVEASLQRLTDDERRYLLLPRLPDEEGLREELQAASLAYQRAAQRAMDQVELGSYARARRTLDEDVRHTADTIVEIAYRGIRFNAERGGALARDIKAIRHRAIVLGWALDAMCGVFAVFAAALLWRVLLRAQLLTAENERLLKRRADELESFSGRVAHDILSPLQAVRFSLSAAARSADQKAAESLARGERALKRVEALTDGLLAFARAAAKPEPGARADVREVVEEVVDELREDACQGRVSLLVQPLPNEAVACEPGILTSLVSNLARNALKYMGESLPREVEIRVVDRGARLRFEVEDTGPGVAPELLGRIFEPYVRGGNYGVAGLGLGLATVRRLAEAHGGEAGVSSKPGAGSVFWFELPKAKAEARPVEPAEPMLH